MAFTPLTPPQRQGPREPDNIEPREKGHAASAPSPGAKAWNLGSLLSASPPVLPLPTKETTALHERSIKELEFSKPKLSLAEATIVEKALKGVASSESIDKKLLMLTEMINRAPEKKSAWPYVLERARQHLLYNTPAHGQAAIDDLMSAYAGCISPEFYFLLSEANLMIGNWRSAHEEHERAIALIGGKREDAVHHLPKAAELIEKIFSPFNDLLRLDPEFAKMWKEIPQSGQCLLMSVYQAGADDQIPVKELLTDIKEKAGRICLLTSLVGDPEGCNWVIDAHGFFLNVKTKIHKKEVDALFETLIHCARFLPDSDERYFFLNGSLDALKTVSESDDVPEMMKKAVQMFEALQNTVVANSNEVGGKISEAMQAYMTQWLLQTDIIQEQEQIPDIDEHHSLMWDSLTEGLKAFEKLAFKYPLLMPRFLIVLREQISVLPKLMELEKKMGAAGFEKLVHGYLACEHSNEIGMSISPLKEEIFERYFVVKDGEATGEYLSIRPDLIEKLSSSQKRRKQAEVVLQLEKERGVQLLSLFLSDMARLDGAVISALQENELFSRQISPELWAPEREFKLLAGRLKMDKKRVYHIFNLASDYPKALQAFMRDSSVWNHSRTTVVSTLFDRITALQKDAKAASLVHPLLMLVEQGKIDLSLKLTNMIQTDKQMGRRLLGIVSSGDVSLVERLLFQSHMHPKDPLTKRMMQQADSLTAPIVRAVLDLQKKKHPIARLIGEESADAPFTPVNCALLTLHAQGDEDLIKQLMDILRKPPSSKSAADKQVLDWAAAGRFSLARGYLARKADETDLWKMIMQDLPANKDSPIPIVIIQQQLWDMHKSLKAVAGKGLDRQLILDEGAQKLLSQKLAKIEYAHEWITFFQPALQAAKAYIDLPSKDRIKQSAAASFPLFPQLDKDLSVAPDVATALADYLITPAGTINTPLIDGLLQTKTIKAMPPNSYTRMYLERVLAALKTDPSFSERLASVRKPPPEGSPQATLLKAFFEIRKGPLTVRDVQRAALSALLWPLRQSAAGSCFGTSVCIHTDSSIQGLKQSLEDYMCLAEKGCLIRKSPYDNSATVSYPLSFDPAAFNEHFKEDNFLARAREFTIATMAGKPDFLRSVKKKWCTYMCSHMDAKVAKWKDAGAKKAYAKIKNSLHQMVRDGIENNIVERYFGYVNSTKKGSERLGAWLAVNKGTEKPLMAGKEEFQKPFLDCLTSIRKKYKDRPENALVERLFSETQTYIRTGGLLEDSFDADMDKLESAFGFDPSHLPSDSPFVDFLGTYERPHQTYHSGANMLVQALPHGSHPIERIFKYIEKLSPNDRAEALQNPSLLKPLDTSNHAMNFAVGEWVPLVAKVKNPAILIKEMQQANSALMGLKADMKVAVNNKPMTLAEAVLQEYCVISRFDSLREAWLNSIDYQIHTNKMTLGQVTQMIINSVVAETGDWRAALIAKSYLLEVITNLECLKPHLPKLYRFLDTNWQTTVGASFGIDLDDSCSSATFTHSDGSAACASRMLWPVEEWEIPCFRHCFDDYSRSYY